MTCVDIDALTEFRIFTASDGNMEHEHFIEGKIQSLAVNQKGELFMTKQPVVGADESIIWK